MYSVYQIMPGDTIDSISEKFNISPVDLRNMNSQTTFRVGEFIVVPQRDSGLFNVYVIKQGDNVYEIAKRYNVNYLDLLKINGLNKDDYIYPNQELLIPREGVSVYITKEDDTIKSVADSLGMTWQELIEQNDTIYLLEDQLIVKRG